MPASPSLVVTLLSYPTLRRIKSPVIKGDLNPIWPVLPGSYPYRGSVSDLESVNLSISVYNNSLITRSLLGSKVVSLRGVSNSGTIKTDVLINPKAIHGGTHACIVKGRFNLMMKSKYQQTGEVVVLRSDEQYICVNVMRVDNVVLAQDRGIVNSIVTVEWSGQTKQTRTVYNSYSPAYNETCFFPMIVPEGAKSRAKEYIKCVQEDLQTHSSITFNLFELGADDNKNSLGSCTFFFDSLDEGKPDDRTYYDERTEQNVTTRQRIWSGRRDLSTPFVSGGGTSHLYFEVYVLFEHEKELQYAGLREKYQDKLPDKDWSYLDRLWDSEEREVQNNFPDETRRRFTLRQNDEYNREHLLPLYLTKMKYPNRKKFEPKKASADTSKVVDEEEIISYLPIEKPEHIAYFVSSIPFDPNEHNEIWASPDFLVAMGKGDIEEHALLLANLLMGAEDVDQSGGLFSKKTTIPPLSSRVFVCIGTLKESHRPHVWVMTIEKNCKDVTFWEASTGKSKRLERRIEQSTDLSEYLRRAESVKKKTKTAGDQSTAKTKRGKKTEEVSEGEEENEDEYESEEGEKGQLDQAVKAEDVFIREDEIDDQYQRLDWKRVGRKTERPKDLNTLEETKTPQSFISKLEKRDEEELKKATTMWVQPRVFPGSAEVVLPYRTIEVIFNNSNVFMNRQHYDPAKILYDVQNNMFWKEYMPGWRTELVSFYTPRSFDAPIHMTRASDLQMKIIKEIRLGISAFRSGINLGTSWMAQSHDIVSLMNKHLVFLEEISRGNVSKEDQRAKKDEFRNGIKERMPPDCKFTALPARFVFIDPDRIRQVLLEESGDFFRVNHKWLKLALSVKLFPYAGSVNSVRVMIATFQAMSDQLNLEGEAK